MNEPESALFVSLTGRDRLYSSYFVSGSLIITAAKTAPKHFDVVFKSSFVFSYRLLSTVSMSNTSINIIFFPGAVIFALKATANFTLVQHLHTGFITYLPSHSHRMLPTLNRHALNTKYYLISHK